MVNILDFKFLIMKWADLFWLARGEGGVQGKKSYYDRSKVNVQVAFAA